MCNINKPHDKFFKETFGDIDVAKDFIKNYIPPDILGIVDLNNLEAEKDSFIDDKMREYYSDLLFKTTVKGREGYIYFLFEHKSYISGSTALQLLKYMVGIWEKLMWSNGKTKKLAVIIPLVIYHGEDKWNVDTSFTELVEDYAYLPANIKKYIPVFEYIVYDLSPGGTGQIKGDTKLKVVLEIIKAIFLKDKNDFLLVFTNVIKLISIQDNEDQDEEQDEEQFIHFYRVLILYIMSARKDINVNEIYKAVQSISADRSEMIMTIAEQLISEGEMKGKKEGVRIGEMKGKKEGERIGEKKGEYKKAVQVAIEMIKDKQPIDRITKYSKLDQATIEELMKRFSNSS